LLNEEPIVTNKKITIGITAIVVAAIVITGAILASGIQLPMGQKTGTLAVSIKDAPVDVKELTLTVNGLSVLGANDEWTQLSLKEGESMTFDLMQLSGDKSLQLSEQTVPAGDYSKIRLNVTQAIATYTDNKGADHTDESLKVPPGHIDIITTFTVGDGQVTGLMIDMQPDSTAISQSGNFKPVVKATVTPIAASTPSPTPTPT
jgi:hypothetical protein